LADGVARRQYRNVIKQSRSAQREAWPLRRLVLRTPRLELRPDDDAGLFELVDEAYRGVHPPEEMPFLVPWTDSPPDQLGGVMLRHFWSQRSAVSPDKWSINFVIRREGRVIGLQEVSGQDFAITREATTGSWLGMRHQGNGYGTEMRTAVLMFLFDHLGAKAARSSAFEDNVRSLAVSRRLGYRPDGTTTYARRGKPATNVRLVLTPADFAAHRPDWPLDVRGLEGVLPMLGLG
jgi:RimJ/RimL family protein N-acetyltransferase